MGPKNRAHYHHLGLARMWVVFAIAATMVAVGVGFFGRGERQKAPKISISASSLEWFDVQHRSFDLMILAEGELEAKNQIEIRSQVQGETTIVELIEEGSHVKKGDLLLKLADDEIQERIEQEKLRVEDAVADKIAAEQNLAIEKSKADSDRKAAKLKLRLAELELEKWKKGDVAKRLRELEMERETTQTDKERRKRDYLQGQKLLKQKFISQSEFDDDKIKKIEAENSYETAKLDQQVYTEYTYPMEEEKFNSGVEQAIGELHRTIQRSNSDLEYLEAKLASKKKSFRIRESRLADLSDQLVATEILAPQDGMVVYATSGGRRRRSDPIEEGRQVYFNETLLLLPDMAQMIAVFRVHEALIPQVVVGQSVVVRIDARQEQAISGQVVQIAVMAEDGGWLNPQLREYAVRVELPAEQDLTLKPAMRCSGEILVDHVKDALVVPIQAIYSEGDYQFCYTPAARHRVSKKTVQIGRSNETFVEILDGLSENDRVLLRNPRPGEVEKK